MPDPRSPPRLEAPARFLRFRTEDSVAASDVGHHRMRAADRVFQFNLMFLARPAAIPIAATARQETAEHTMLGVENGQMLISNHFNLRRTSRSRQLRNLRGVQIMRRRYSRKPESQ